MTQKAAGLQALSKLQSQTGRKRSQRRRTHTMSHLSLGEDVAPLLSVTGVVLFPIGAK